jgi:peptide methionine sulfoxide reductase msrA/msrB
MFTAKDTRHCANSLALNFVAKANEERGIFAGGCFWGVEHHLERIPGVLTVISGYVGGTVPNPTYQNVLSKRTGHAEAVEVIYDSSKVSYEKIAKMFFEIHDPTQVDRQGPDIGEQYRSEVFYVNDEQKATAEKLIDILKSKGMKVATKVTLAGTFWAAEDYHQDYYAVTGKEPYCHSWTQRFDDDEEVM